MFFFLNDTTPTEIYTYLRTLSLPDALPISIDLRFRGKGPATDVRRILRRGGGYRVSNGLVTFNEPRHALKHAQHILGHQHLAIAPRRSANANGRTRHRLCYLVGDLFHHTLDHQQEATRGIDGPRIAHDLLGFRLAFPAGTITAKRVHCLGRQADMGADWNTPRREKGDG